MLIPEDIDIFLTKTVKNDIEECNKLLDKETFMKKYPNCFQRAEDRRRFEEQFANQHLKSPERHRVWQTLDKMANDENLRSKYCSFAARRETSALSYYCNAFQSHETNLLKQHTLGNQAARKEWIKKIDIFPFNYKLHVDSEESCRLFRLPQHSNRAHITFLKITFPKRSSLWQFSEFTRLQAETILLRGISIAQAKYDFFFYSDSDLRSKQCWLYSLQLSKHYSVIQSALNDLGRFQSIKNPGKKMARVGLMATSTVTLCSVKLRCLLNLSMFVCVCLK